MTLDEFLGELGKVTDSGFVPIHDNIYTTYIRLIKRSGKERLKYRPITAIASIKTGKYYSEDFLGGEEAAKDIGLDLELCEMIELADTCRENPDRPDDSNHIELRKQMLIILGLPQD